MPKQLAREHVQVNFRMPSDLKARIEAAAKENSRSTTAEIVAALEEKYPAPTMWKERIELLGQTVRDLEEAMSNVPEHMKAAVLERVQGQLREQHIEMSYDRGFRVFKFLDTDATISFPDSADGLEESLEATPEELAAARKLLRTHPDRELALEFRSRLARAVTEGRPTAKIVAQIHEFFGDDDPDLEPA